MGRESDSQLVVASRYGGLGDADSFSRGRAVMSSSATRLTKAFFPRRLAGVLDPMSGFFAVRRDAVDVDTLRPNGFKILLEIAVRSGPLRTSELPFHFGSRFAGESKASLREGFRLLVLLMHLWFDVSAGRGSRMVAFGAVGASGLLVNTAALWCATGLVGLHYAVEQLLPPWCPAPGTGQPWRRSCTRAPAGAMPPDGSRFGALDGVALILRIPLMALLIEAAGVGYLWANVISLLAIFVVRFAVSDSLIFRRSQSAVPKRTDARQENISWPWDRRSCRQWRPNSSPPAPPRRRPRAASPSGTTALSSATAPWHHSLLPHRWSIAHPQPVVFSMRGT